MPLEVQPAGRDHALERLQRRARGAAARRAGLRADERARHLAFVLGGAAVLAQPGAGGFHRRRDFRRLDRFGVFRCACDQTACRDQADALFDEATLGFVHRGASWRFPCGCALETGISDMDSVPVPLGLLIDARHDLSEQEPCQVAFASWLLVRGECAVTPRARERAGAAELPQGRDAPATPRIRPPAGGCETRRADVGSATRGRAALRWSRSWSAT